MRCLFVFILHNSSATSSLMLVISFYVIVLTWFPFLSILCVFLSLCLLSRYERFQEDGGSEDFSEFLGSLLNSIVDKIEDKVEAKVEDIVEDIEDINESRGLRYPRMSGAQRAAKDRRDQRALGKMIKLTSFCATDVDLQVLSLSSSLRNIIFPE